MIHQELETFREKFVHAKTVTDRIALLDQLPAVQKILSKPHFFRTFLQGVTPECECVLKQCAAIGQLIDVEVPSADAWRALLNILLPIDHFYREIGGIIGYQAEVVKRLQKTENPKENVFFHSPFFEDISKETEEVMDWVRVGLESLPQVAEFYPLGGAADRLHLVDEQTGLELPAAKLRFAGRTLLETLIRDLQAREWLYYRLFGEQITTPIGIMTSMEKGNHGHVTTILEQHDWFGRPKESYCLFQQPLVPAVDEKGDWHSIKPLFPFLKPGGHGAIWKLARDRGVFRWLESLGVQKALVRQINNPLAGLDYGLLAFSGIGCKKDMSFGFASCSRVIQSAEGMVVLIEKETGEIVLTNIEYCDFSKFGIEDKPIRPGEPHSRFTSNTNILFIDLKAVLQAVESHPFPGLLMNLKPICISNEEGKQKEVLFGRLESTMQNIADAFSEIKKSDVPLKTEKTFATYNARQKTISVAKKAYLPGKPLLETPEQCFYELLGENLELLKECGFSVPLSISVDEYLEQGPSAVFLYHPALGPLYSIIRQKLRGGKIAAHSEWILEIAETDISNLILEGSLRVVAKQILGSKDSSSTLRYSEAVGRCRLSNCTVRNKGVEWGKSAPFWKMDLQRKESVLIELKGNSEFVAESICFEGNWHFVVEDGERVTLKQKNGIITTIREPVARSPFWRYSWPQMRLERP